MSTTDIMGYTEPMGRWKPDARGRLMKAAMELYAKRGFEQTTVAEIAERAGLTERTFFRHFADKREVLFASAGDLEQGLLRALEAAPRSLAPIDAIAAALAVVFVEFSDRDFSRRRQAIIAANPELQERERIKLASLAVVAAGALHRRGVAKSTASLAAETAIAVFRIAFERWITEKRRRDLPSVIRDSFDELKAVARL